MPIQLSALLVYALAALAEIAGCFAFWAWARNGQAIWWLAPGLVALRAVTPRARYRCSRRRP